MLEYLLLSETEKMLRQVGLYGDIIILSSRCRLYLFDSRVTTLQQQLLLELTDEECKACPRRILLEPVDIFGLYTFTTLAQCKVISAPL